MTLLSVADISYHFCYNHSYHHCRATITSSTLMTVLPSIATIATVAFIVLRIPMTLSTGDQQRRLPIEKAT